MPREVMALLWVAIIGLVAWLLVAYVPLPAPFPTVIVIAAVIFAILLIFRVMGWNMTPP